MIAFAALLDDLACAPGKGPQEALLRRYFGTVADPDRAMGLAVLTGAATLKVTRPALLRALAAERFDPVLFGLGHGFVGDVAETVALMWPERAGANAAPPGLAEVVRTLGATAAADVPAQIARFLDVLPAGARLWLLKGATGGTRVRVPAPILRAALAGLSAGRLTAGALEEVWHGLVAPYAALFAWIEGRGGRPDPGEGPQFHPLMPAEAVGVVAGLDAARWRAEWQWEGERVQLVAGPGGRRVFGRGAEDISATTPGLIAAMGFDAVLDGVLLTPRGRPHQVRLHDVLFEAGEDLRPLPFDQRRARLDAWFARVAPLGMDLSPLLDFATPADLAALHRAARDHAATGLILKDRASPYTPGRAEGAWRTWQRDSQSVTAVLMYVERGGDLSFGVWREDGVLVPVGKCTPDLPRTARATLDAWVRTHTLKRFGPVREVAPGLVLQVACDAAELSSRHKAGVTLRAARLVCVRPDVPAAAADRLELVLALARPGPSA